MPSLRGNPPGGLSLFRFRSATLPRHAFPTWPVRSNPNRGVTADRVDLGDPAGETPPGLGRHWKGTSHPAMWSVGPAPPVWSRSALHGFAAGLTRLECARHCVSDVAGVVMAI